MSEQPLGTFEGDEHVFPLRVYYEDTDAAGIVYHANYLRFAERARTEMLRFVGLNHTGMMATEGVVFAVRHCTADFLAPARLDDRLEVVTRFTGVRGASLGMEQRVRREGTDLVRMFLQLACMTLSGRPSRIPRTLRTDIEDFRNRNDG